MKAGTGDGTDSKTTAKPRHSGINASNDQATILPDTFAADPDRLARFKREWCVSHRTWGALLARGGLRGGPRNSDSLKARLRCIPVVDYAT